MALQGTLFLDHLRKEYNVLEFEYDIYQPLSDKGSPTAHPMGGILSFTINSLGNDDTTFQDWMLGKQKFLDGYFEFPIADQSKPVKIRKIKFERAKCINLYEYFSEHNAEHMQMKLRISPTKVDFGGGVWDTRDREYEIGE